MIEMDLTFYCKKQQDHLELSDRIMTNVFTMQTKESTLREHATVVAIDSWETDKPRNSGLPKGTQKTKGFTPYSYFTSDAPRKLPNL